MPRGVRSIPPYVQSLATQIAGHEYQLKSLHKQQQIRMGEFAAAATVYLMDRGHRPTGEAMEAHFSGTCRCADRRAWRRRETR